jgi:glycosyltransferase involved in cell wall biosynthesis
MKPFILFILHYPPPINGASIVGKYIKESAIVNQAIKGDYINLTTSFKLNLIGKRDLAKLFHTLKILLQVFKALFKNPYSICYMTLSASGLGFYKDFLIVLLIKLFQKRVIFHFHNKGIASRKPNYIKHILCCIIFKNSQTILISELLYPDIKRYVRRDSLFICPNGIPPIESSDLAVKSSLTKEGCKLLYFSNMIREKGVFVLLEACKVLKEAGFLFECHFVGAWMDISH